MVSDKWQVKALVFARHSSLVTRRFSLMLALRYEGGQLAVAEREKPRGADEAVVRVTLSGICNTDVEIARGYAGFEGTIGHEFVGVVESAAEPALVGRRVAAVSLGRPSSGIAFASPSTMPRRLMLSGGASTWRCAAGRCDAFVPRAS